MQEDVEETLRSDINIMFKCEAHTESGSDSGSELRGSPSQVGRGIANPMSERTRGFEILKGTRLPLPAPFSTFIILLKSLAKRCWGSKDRSVHCMDKSCICCSYQYYGLSYSQPLEQRGLKTKTTILGIKNEKGDNRFGPLL